MAISNASIFGRKAQENNGERKASFKYPVLRPGQYTLQLIRIEDFKDEKYGKPEYDFMKIRFLFVLLQPGAEDATTKEAQDRLRQKGHGKYFSLEMHPICSPPGRNRKTGESTKPSNLYELLRVMVNGGEPLTPEQLGLDAETKKLPAAQRVQVAAERLAAMLTDLEARKPQVFGMLVQKVNTRGEKYNKLKEIVDVVPDDERLPDYKPFPRPVDPREEDDDPTIICESCGERVRGYERRVDGEWVDNRTAAEQSKENYGEVLCGACIYKRKQEMETEEAPF